MEPNTPAPVPPAPAPAPSSSPSPAAYSPLTRPTELLRSAWAFYKANWALLVPIVAIPYAVMYVGQILSLKAFGGLNAVGILLSIIGGLGLIAMQGALIDGIDALAKQPGSAISWREQYRKGFGMFGSLILLVLMQMAIAMGSYILFIVPGIIVSVYISMVMFARVIDGKKGWEAFTESYSLVYGKWWAVLGRMLFGGLVYLGGAIAIGIIGSILQSISGAPTGSQAELAISLTLNMLLSCALLPLLIAYMYNLYAALRSAKEPVAQPSFKGWLTAFLVIGILLVVSLPFIFGAVYAFMKSKGIDMRIQGTQTSGSFQVKFDGFKIGR